MFDNWRLLVFRQLILVVAVLAVAGSAVAAFNCPFFFVVLAVVGGACLGLFARAPRLAVILGILPLLFWLYVDFREGQVNSNNLLSTRHGRLVVVKGIVEDKPSPTAGGRGQFILQAKDSGKCLIRFVGTVNLSAGDCVQAKVLLDKPPCKLAAWHFDTQSYLHKRGISCSGRLIDMQSRMLKPAEKTWLQSVSEAISSSRQRLVDTHVEFLGESEGKLLTSMVIGDRAVHLPEALVKQFRDVGLSHVLAASGFNLTIVTGWTLFLVRRLFKSSWLGHLSCLLSMLAFVVMAGPSPSVLRAAFMLCVVIFYRMIARKAPLSAALAVALILSILIDPLCITDIGFQLSYVATAAIIWGVQPLQQLFVKLPRCFGIGEAVSVILIAQMSVLPIQLYYFWSIGLFFLPANLLVAPLVHLVTLSGFATCLMILVDQQLHLLAPLICFADKITGYPLAAILLCVEYMASFDEAKLVIGAPHLLCLVFYYVALVFLLYSLQAARFRCLAGCLLIIAICFLSWRPVQNTCLIAFFKDSIAVVDLNRNAQVLGRSDVPAVRRFLLYHGAKVLPQATPSEEGRILVPGASALVLRVTDESIGSLSIEEKWQTLVLIVKGKRPVNTIDLLLGNEQLHNCIERGKKIWFVVDRALSKKSQNVLAGRLPSCAKIATRTSESLVFEAVNESIKIRD